MGSEEAKPEQNVDNPPKNKKDDLNNSPKMSPRKSLDKSNPNSNRNSAMDNYLNQSPIKSPSKNPSKGPSKRNSPDLKPSKNSSVKPSRSPTKQTNNNKPKSKNELIEEDNQFMPLMNWPAEGTIQLKINLVELIVEEQEKPYLTKNYSTYKATLKWKKINSNIFSFKLREEPSYEVNLQIDLQGDVLSGSQKVWMALSPINIPFGRTVKLGNFKVVNVFRNIGGDLEDEQELGPSLKNIQFPISEQIFGKWGEKVPHSISDKEESKKRRRRKINKFKQYEETSRYFDFSNVWMGSTYVEETINYFRGWLIQVNQIDPKLSAELNQDLKNREEFYIETMYKKLN